MYFTITILILTLTSSLNHKRLYLISPYPGKKLNYHFLLQQFQVKTLHIAGITKKIGLFKPFVSNIFFESLMF